MDTIIEMLKNPWLWLVIASAVVSVIGISLYPQQTQDLKPIISDYNSSTMIDVVVAVDDEKQALAVLAMNYPGYVVVEKVYIPEDHSWVFRIKKGE